MEYQRCCETVRSAILATAWLLVFTCSRTVHGSKGLTDWCRFNTALDLPLYSAIPRCKYRFQTGPIANHVPSG